MTTILGCFGSQSESTSTSKYRKALETGLFFAKLLEIENDIKVSYVKFELKLNNLIDEYKRNKLDLTKTVHTKPSRPKLKKQKSIDLVDANKNTVVEQAQLQPPQQPQPPQPSEVAVKTKTSSKAGGKVIKMIKMFEAKSKLKRVGKLINEVPKKIKEKVIDKRKLKLSTLRKENKLKSAKRVSNVLNAFLNDEANHHSAVLVNIGDIYETSHLDAHMVLRHGVFVTSANMSAKKPYVINHKIREHHHHHYHHAKQHATIRMKEVDPMKTPTNMSIK